MILRVPTSTDPAVTIYTQRSTLDGVEYVFHFRWNTRGSFWSFDLHDADDAPIASGIKVVPEWNLLRRVTDARKPPGKLIAADFAGAGNAPGLTGLGADVVLYYFDAAEVADALAQ